jgi:hypothetical protein
MDFAAEPDPAKLLYDELQEHLRVHDRDAAIRVYCELLSSRPLAEVIRMGAPARLAERCPEQQRPAEVRAAGPGVPPPAVAERLEDATAAKAGASAPRRRTVEYRKKMAAPIRRTLSLTAILAAITFPSQALVDYTKRQTEITVFAEKAGDALANSAVSLSTPSPRDQSTPAGEPAQADPIAPSKPAGPRGYFVLDDKRLDRTAPARSAVAPTVAAGAPSEQDVEVVQPGTRPRPETAAKASRLIALAGRAAGDPPAAAAIEPRDGVAATTKRTEQGGSETEFRLLVSRGDALLGTGDLTSARLFYRRAADIGGSTAALRLGETFDPAFLQQAGLDRVAGDPQEAFRWYRRARDLGNRDAGLLLKHLSLPGGNSP